MKCGNKQIGKNHCINEINSNTKQCLGEKLCKQQGNELRWNEGDKLGEAHTHSPVNIIRNIEFVSCPGIIGRNPEEIISRESSRLWNLVEEIETPSENEKTSI